MRVVLVGPPGAGKGTQAQFLASHLSIPKISTGDIFRDNVSHGTALGRRAQAYMERGDRKMLWFIGGFFSSLLSCSLSTPLYSHHYLVTPEH